MKLLEATRRKWTTDESPAWNIWLGTGLVGTMWKEGQRYGWRVSHSGFFGFASTREAACEALIIAYGLDATPPERWP